SARGERPFTVSHQDRLTTPFGPVRRAGARGRPPEMPLRGRASCTSVASASGEKQTEPRRPRLTLPIRGGKCLQPGPGGGHPAQPSVTLSEEGPMRNQRFGRRLPVWMVAFISGLWRRPAGAEPPEFEHIGNRLVIPAEDFAWDGDDEGDATIKASLLSPGGQRMKRLLKHFQNSRG